MNATPIITYLALGSNINSPKDQLTQAVKTLQKQEHGIVTAISPFYRNPPLGSIPQPDFINAVLEFSTTLSPQQLLQVTQALEQQQQRERQQKWGPRTLDIDILWYDGLTLTLPELTLPHPGLTTRRFFLQPLVDINPTLRLPSGHTTQAALQQCPAWPLEPVQNL